MDAQDYIDEMRARQRRNLIIGIAVAVILALIMVPRILSLFGVGDDLPDLETALAEMPELALTEAEIGLADTILEPDIFRNALTYEATGVTTFALEEVQEIIAPVLPEQGEIIEIGVQGAVVYIDYRTEGLRTTLEYVDADRSGSVDRIHKSVAQEEAQSGPLVPESQNFCQVRYTVATGETALVEFYDFS